MATHRRDISLSCTVCRRMRMNCFSDSFCLCLSHSHAKTCCRERRPSSSINEMLARKLSQVKRYQVDCCVNQMIIITRYTTASTGSPVMEVELDMGCHESAGHPINSDLLHQERRLCLSLCLPLDRRASFMPMWQGTHRASVNAPLHHAPR